MSNYTHALGLLSHIFFFAFFVFLEVKILAVFNIFSIALFVGTLALSKRGYLDAALFIGGLEVGAHQALAVLALGLGPSFQHYLLILAVGTLYYRHIPLRTRVGMAILPLLGYISVHVYGLHFAPWYSLSAVATDVLAALNVTLFVIILMGMCVYFQVYVERARILAERLAQSKTIFLANMSHELRTPLNAILGFAQILKRSDGLSEQDRKNLSTINRSGEHLLDLINDILDMSKLEEGKLLLQRATFDLPRLLGDLQGMFALAARRKNLELTFEIGADLPRLIRGDELRLRQVLINLIGNALKFTSRGEVKVVARRVLPAPLHGPSHLYFRVEDSGTGIARDELGELFQLFVQAEAGRKSRRGTGLGLALSQRFVHLLGGAIHVESEVGRGSAFWFEIPAEMAEATGAEKPGEQRQVTGVRGDGVQRRMLVVDDNAENRDVLVQFLSGLGFEVACANDGALGVAEWARFAPDLIWMDLRMPVMDGQEACRTICQQAREGGKPAPKVVAISASSLDGGRASGEQSGFSAYVGKPFREAELYAIMRELLKIEFVYAESEEPARNVNAGGRNGKVVLAMQLGDVAPTLRQSLSEAAMLADFDGTQAVIRQIAEMHPELAARLHEFLEEYRFDTLQELLSE